MMSANLYGWPSGSAASGTGAFERAAERGKVRPRPLFGASAMLRAALLSLMFASPAAAIPPQIVYACTEQDDFNRGLCTGYILGALKIYQELLPDGCMVSATGSFEVSNFINAFPRRAAEMTIMDIFMAAKGAPETCRP